MNPADRAIFERSFDADTVRTRRVAVDELLELVQRLDAENERLERLLHLCAPVLCLDCNDPVPVQNLVDGRCAGCDYERTAGGDDADRS